MSMRRSTSASDSRSADVLELDSLSRAFNETRAVDGVSLSVERGQMVGIIGRSGAGKSTLLRLINRLIEADHGHISYGDLQVSGLQGRSLRRWRARCAMIFQQFNLVGRLDVITNVLVGRIGYKSTLPAMFKSFTPDERAMAVSALERVDLVPQALQRADTLSGGQQQRVAIARALVQQPSVILADEPIASLDPANARRVMDALRAINRDDGITVLCNLHHLDTAREYCDRIVGMADGKLMFDGKPDALSPRQAQTIYGTDQAVDEWGHPSGPVHPAAA